MVVRIKREKTVAKMSERQKSKVYLWWFGIWESLQPIDSWNAANFTWIFSFFSFKYIEQPIRYKISNSQFVKLILFLLLISTILSSYFIYKNGLPNRFPNIVNSKSIDDRFLNETIYRKCHKTIA